MIDNSDNDHEVVFDHNIIIMILLLLWIIIVNT